MQHATANAEPNKKPFKSIMLLCGAMLSGVLALMLFWVALSGGYIIVVSSTVLSRLPFFVGVLFLMLCISLSVSAYRSRIPKMERTKIFSGIRWLFIMPVVVFCFLVICICVAEAGDKAFELSSADSDEQRTVILLNHTFMGDRYAVIYELPPHSIIAHKTDYLYSYDPAWRW